MNTAAAINVLTVLAERDRPMFKRVAKHKAQAWVTDGKTIFVSDGLMKLLADEHELAFFLGHELGHVALWHTRFWSRFLAARRLDRELAADAHAVRLMRAKGYDTGRLPWLFDRLAAGKTGKALRELAARKAAILNLIEGA